MRVEHWMMAFATAVFVRNAARRSSPSLFVTGFTTTARTTTFGAKKKEGGMRRKRPKFDPSKTVAFIEQMQREHGKYMEFQFGEFVSPTSTSSSMTSTTLWSTTSSSSSTTAISSDEKEELTSSQQQQPSTTRAVDLPSVFPLQGKLADDCPSRYRFAPSPTGSLHVGGARTALYNWLMAKKAQLASRDGGSDANIKPGFVLRVEDTDLARSTKESEASVLQDLQWLGLTWDEGPDMEVDSAIQLGPYRQSERLTLYQQAAYKLLQQGKAYRCFCTPEELDEMKAQQEAQGIPPRYDGRWRDADQATVDKCMDAGMPYTIRFKVPSGARVVVDDVVRGTVSWDAEATVGDFILLRSNGVPVYNFCVAVDDACMGITTVIRAEEHLTNTLRQALILDALDAPRPRYAHCSLILGSDKQKLSKRHGATSCDQYRLDGFLPDAMINYLALLGWNDGSDEEIFTRDELIDAFDVDRVVKSPSVFDLEKLKWVNAQHLKMMSVESILGLVQEQLQWQGLLRDDVVELCQSGNDDDESVQSAKAAVRDFVYGATALAKQMMETTKDAALNAKTVLGYNLPATWKELVSLSEQPSPNGASNNNAYQEAKEMIMRGHFYGLATTLVQQYRSGEFPLPISDALLAAFQDARGMAIEEDSQKGAVCQFTNAYMAHMKSLAKAQGVKGKNLFHPVRLALTGEMSGQDVTKQLSLLAIACRENNGVIDLERAGVVPLDQRMERLQSFCETIPEQYRKPQKTKTETTKPAQGSAPSAAGAAAEASTTATDSKAISAPQDPLDSYDGPPITALDIRVGKILKVWEHEEADKLYCEEIDVGEEEPRQIASGLRPYLSKEDMEGRLVLVLCNLKTRKLVGFPSHGMVLCASNADHTEVQLVNPPVTAKIGERIVIPDLKPPSGDDDGQPYAENKIGKKKVLEKLAPYLVTSKYGVPEFMGRPFMTSAGVCTSPIPDGTVS